jgi:hypothetical protein
VSTETEAETAPAAQKAHDAKATRHANAVSDRVVPCLLGLWKGDKEGEGVEREVS